MKRSQIESAVKTATNVRIPYFNKKNGLTPLEQHKRFMATIK